MILLRWAFAASCIPAPIVQMTLIFLGIVYLHDGIEDVLFLIPDARPPRAISARRRFGWAGGRDGHVFVITVVLSSLLSSTLIPASMHPHVGEGERSTRKTQQSI